MSFVGEKTYTVTDLQIYSCSACGAPIALADNQVNSLRRTKNNFYCPMGHVQHFPGKTNEQLLREQLEASRAFANRLEREKQFESNRARAEKAAKTRIKNRIAKGVCPCCNRTFENLARHMQNKHPGYSHD